MDIILYHHLGLGDHFICNALVLTVAKQYDKVHLISWSRNLPTVNHLYADYENIEVHGIVNEPQDIIELSKALQLQVLAVGFQHCDVNDFEASFYRQLNLDPDIQYSEFRLPSDLANANQMYQNWYQEHGSEDYIFVHDTSSVRKFDLKISGNMLQYRTDVSQTRDLLDYIVLIQNAREIHVINSSIQALIWPMLKQGLIPRADIFYHDVRNSAQGGAAVRIPQDPRVTTVKYNNEYVMTI